MSQVTTHILDTSKGHPAAQIHVTLYQGGNDQWREIARAISDADGRVKNLLGEEVLLQHGIYKLRFETKDYFDQLHIATCYPYVEIIFDVQTDEHFHVPLLLNPFGYSTYRGS